MVATTALARMRQTQKRAYHNAGCKSSGLPGNFRTPNHSYDNQPMTIG